ALAHVADEHRRDALRDADLLLREALRLDELHVALRQAERLQLRPLVENGDAVRAADVLERLLPTRAEAIDLLVGEVVSDAEVDAAGRGVVLEEAPVEADRVD